MGILDVFKRKEVKKTEANTMLGMTALGNNILIAQGSKPDTPYAQLLYVTTGSSTNAGRPVDMSMLSRNSTVMACIAAKARALSQTPIRIMAQADDGTYVDAIKNPDVGRRDKEKAKSVYNLLSNPNNFQSQYEFWYRWMMWYELSGEAFTLWWRKDQESSTQTPLIPALIS